MELKTYIVGWFAVYGVQEVVRTVALQQWWGRGGDTSSYGCCPSYSERRPPVGIVPAVIVWLQIFVVLLVALALERRVVLWSVCCHCCRYSSSCCRGDIRAEFRLNFSISSILSH